MIGIIKLYRIMSWMIGQAKTRIMDNFKHQDQEKD